MARAIRFGAPRIDGGASHFVFVCVLVLINFSIQAADGSSTTLKSHPLAKRVDAHLLPVLDAYRANLVNEAEAAAKVKAAHPGSATKTPKPEQIAIRIDAEVTAQTLKEIAATGASIVSSAARWNAICAYVTVSQLDALTRVENINAIRLQPKPQLRQQGLAANQGDSVMHTDALRTQYSLSGSGQIVGVMSDSVTDTKAVGPGSVNGIVPNAIVTNTIPQTDNGPNGTHDLPSSFQVIDFGPGGGTDEGEGMMEVIHDIAPNAALAFASCGIDQSSMGSNLLLLRSAGHCTVTCDDIAFIDEPCFQDGPIAQAITANRNAGVAHFSAFGNNANQGILTTYKAMNSSADNQASPPNGSCFHDWGNGIGAFLPINVPAGDSVLIILQWDQPFSSYRLGPGSSADLDMFLCPSASLDFNNMLGSSQNGQGSAGAPSGDPLEYIDYSNSSASAQTVYLVINHYQGTRTGSNGSSGNNMRIILFDNGGGCLPKVTPVGGNQMSAFGHATAQSCVGVAAAYYGQSQTPEKFSSKGGDVPYYFNAVGSPAAFTHFAPDLTAPDGVSTYAFNNGKSFYGTSCAAPNAAAMAALLLQAAPGSTPAQLVSAMQSGATDITAAPTEDSSCPMSGMDVYSGAGMISATHAYGPPKITSPLTVNTNVGSQFSYSIVTNGLGNMTYTAAPMPGGLSFLAPTISGIPTTQGSSTVNLTVSNAAGQTNATLTINVGPPVPVVITTGPTAAPNPVLVNTSTAFNVGAVGSGRGFTYVWNFGDGTTAGSGQSPAHVYVRPGTYTVQVNISDLNGQSAKGSVQVIVKPPPIVVSNPIVAPQPAYTGMNVQFTSSATGGFGALAYAWTLGDGATSSEQNPTHVYSSAGTFNATLNVTDSTGQLRSVGFQVLVVPNVTVSFTSVATASPTSAGIGQTINFSSAAIGNGAPSFSWNFGDGATASTANVSHAYMTPGTFTATVTATDLTNSAISSSVTVNIVAPLIGSGPDSDGDGISDAIELLAGTNPHDPHSSPVADPTSASTPLNISGMQVKLNFSKQGTDSITLNGELPLPSGTSLDQTIVVNIGGFTMSLTMNNGQARTQSGGFVVKKSKGMQTAKFSLKLVHLSIADSFEQLGLINGSISAQVSIPITFIFNGFVFSKTQTLNYSGKAGKTGAAK